MDVVISSGWRSGIENIAIEQLSEPVSQPTMTAQGDTFVSKHGRYQVTITQEADGWLVEYTSTGRLFGPRELIYSARHTVARHAAWDVMCRVIRATNSEQEGIAAARRAARWLQARQPVC
jgi:hypothetical protein